MVRLYSNLGVVVVTAANEKHHTTSRHNSSLIITCLSWSISSKRRKLVSILIRFSIKGSPDTAVKLLPCDHEVIGSSPRNNLLQKMQGKAVYIRPKVVRPFPGDCASGSYVHQAAFFLVCSHALL
jgi:hypothetical protein